MGDRRGGSWRAAAGPRPHTAGRHEQLLSRRHQGLSGLLAYSCQSRRLEARPPRHRASTTFAEAHGQPEQLHVACDDVA